MRVFVSSTYEDLADHREAVDRILHRLTLQFRGMEVFGARPHEPKQVCFAEIASCSIFIGLYAHRYGWIPPGDVLSITEQEFDEARRLQKPCYCYVVDPNHPWNPRLIDVPALEQLKRLHAKLGTLVRSHFTTPDDLAKQIAADLAGALKEQHPTQTTDDLIGYLRTCISHEIATTIGTKYIRDLYVDRGLDYSLTYHLRPSRVQVTLAQLCDSLDAITSSLLSLSGNALESATYIVSPRVDHSSFVLRSLAQLPSSDRRLNYPASAIEQELTPLRDILLAIERGLSSRDTARDSLLEEKNAPLGDALVAAARDLASKTRDVTEVRRLLRNVQSAISGIAETRQALKPLCLVVDRAGGGKTNLLCHLAEQLAQEMPTFFLAARSVPSASEDALVRYLASLYPLGPDPIMEAVATIGTANLHCLIVIDGVNEHFDVASLNGALKALVRRYYGQPVKFLVSCRDIYWRYFEDDWWLAHSSLISRDALYSFTRLEYRRALPLYLAAFDIDVNPVDAAKDELHHPLLLRFFCEAYRGTPSHPTRLGTLSELRLLELFDEYCDRKFNQIRSRLGLIDSEDVLQFVKMIASMMLEWRRITLPVEAVAERAREKLGERTIRSLDSRYVQILDEDILIEERPAGALSERVVAFVYDEFMEYMIARTIWSSCVQSSGDLVATLVPEVKKLALGRKSFISADGIVLYLGEMVARVSEDDALKFVDALVALRMADVACNFIVRVVSTASRESLFTRVLDLHREGSRVVRHRAWAAIEQMAMTHWQLLLEYLATKGRKIPGEYAFSVIRRASVGRSNAEQYDAVSLMLTAMSSEQTLIAADSEKDFATGVNAVRAIAWRASQGWIVERKREVEERLEEVRSLRDTQSRELEAAGKAKMWGVDA